MGRNYKLTIVEEQEVPLKFQNGFYLSKEALTNAKDIFIQWYKEEAYHKIAEQVEFYAKRAGLKYNKVKITNAQKRWGSCSSANNLNFSWSLIMAPLKVLDYVVVHELCHLIERNHSQRFWTKVKTMMPDYEKYRDWLNEYGYLLRI